MSQFDESKIRRDAEGKFANKGPAAEASGVELEDLYGADAGDPDLDAEIAAAQARYDEAEREAAAAQAKLDEAAGHLEALHKRAQDASYSPLSSIPADQPVDVNHPEIQNGAVRDVVVSDGTTYYRRREGHYADVPYSVRVQFDRPITDDEMNQAAGITGYALRAAGQVEGGYAPERDSPYSFTMFADTTKGRAYRHMEEFEEMANTYMAEGSPIRKTDRAGAGTKGTRLVDGIQGAPKFELYYDSTISFDDNKKSDQNGVRDLQ